MTRTLAQCAAAALLLLSMPGAADIHQWRDAQGNLHFSDKAPTDVASERVEVNANIYQSADLPTHPSSNTGVAPPVVLYSTTWCGYCKKARTHFQRRKVAFTEYDVEKTAKGRSDYARFGRRGVPVILVGEQRLQGFSVAAFEQAYAHGQDN